MAQGLRGLLDLLFPAGEGKKRTSELIQRGLEALRLMRDERGLETGGITRVPSRMELRLAQVRFDELAEMGAVRDIEIYFNDELMKDLKGRKMRTFGDHPIYVTIAADSTLQPNEIYVAVLPPEEEPVDRVPGAVAHRGSAEPYDRTSVLGEEQTSVPRHPGMPPPHEPKTTYSLVIREEGRSHQIRLEGKRWIIGRHGSSGQGLPEGYRKIDLDLPATVSREQVRVDLIGGDRLRVERIGKAPVTLQNNEELDAGDNRLLPLGTPFYIEKCELKVVGTVT